MISKIASDMQSRWVFSKIPDRRLSVLLILSISFVEFERTQRLWVGGLAILVLFLEHMIARRNQIEVSISGIKWTQRRLFAAQRVLHVPANSVQHISYVRPVRKLWSWWRYDQIVIQSCEGHPLLSLTPRHWGRADNGDTLVGTIVKHPIFSKLLEPREWQGLQVDDHEEKAALYRGYRQLIYGLILVMLFALFVILDPHITLIWGWYWAAVAVLFLLTCYFGYPIFKTKMNQVSPVMVVLSILLFGFVACSSLLPLISATSHSKPVLLILSRADKGGEYWQLRQGITVGCAPTGRAIGSQQSTLLYTHAWLGVQRVNHRAICRVSD